MSTSEKTYHKSILFRVDASPVMGSGHLMRCLALAEMFAAFQHKVTFASHQCPDAFLSRISALGFPILPLQASTSEAELFSVIEQVSPHGIVIDGYQFDSHYRQLLHETGCPVVTFDDSNLDFPLHADIVLNPSPLATEDNYNLSAPNACLFLGPEYVALRPEFKQVKTAAHMEKSSENPDKPHIFISFGGSDPAKLTLPVIEKILGTYPDPIPIDVIVGGAAGNQHEITALANEYPDRINVHINSSKIANIMSDACLAISAAGSTLWELAYLGIPTIAVVVAENQTTMLKSPLRHWFNSLDALHNHDIAVDHVIKKSLTLFQQPTIRIQQMDTLKTINVGNKANQICETFNAMMAKNLR